MTHILLSDLLSTWVLYFYTMVMYLFCVFFRTLAMIKPDAVTKIGDIIQMIYDANLIVTKSKMTKLTW